MAGNMEDILMGGGSDSDDSDDNNTKSTPAAPAPAAPSSSSSSRTSAPPPPAAPPTSAPVATGPPPPNSSKSELTNRLKTLYASPSNAAPPPSSSTNSAPIASSSLPRGGIQVPPAANRPPAPAPAYNAMPPPQQQQSYPANRMPAPLPKARSTNRSAPPSNRMASVPSNQPQYHPQQQHQQQQYHMSRPPSSGYQHHSTSRLSSSRSSVPPQPKSHPQQRPSTTQQQIQHRGSSSGGSRERDLTDHEKKEKEKFLMFTRVLMKYLEQRDKEMHQKAKAQIKECYEKNKSGDPNFKSLTTSMKSKLRETVGENYWRKAHDYLEHFFRQKQQGKDKDGKLSMSLLSKHVGSAPAPSQSSQPAQPAAPPSSVTSRTAAPAPSSRHPVQSQAQAAAAMKMPHPSGTRPTTTAPTSTGVLAPTSAATTAPLAPLSAEEKKKKEELEKKEKNNARNRQRRALAKKKKEEAEKAKQVALAAKASAVGSVTADPLATGVVVGATPTTNTPSTIGVSSVSTGSVASKKDTAKAKKGLKHSSSVSSVGSLKKKSVVKEYNQDMDQLDHAVMIDVKSLPNLLAKEFMSDFNLNEEQRKLLYGDAQQCKVKEITDAAAKVLSSESVDEKLKENGVAALQFCLPNMYNGWGEKNVVSARTAWAKIRLPERENKMIEMERAKAEEARKDAPMGDPASLEKPTSESKMAMDIDTETLPPLKIEDDTTNHVWYNETRASQDPTLALLSEATELYLKSAIEKAVGKSRLRQNLDGVRLYNTLVTRHASKNTVTSLPPAEIRLGCDVRRQIALAEGNAAKTYQRMEEAIDRQNDSYPVDATDLDPMTTVLESTSMADLSTKPPLKSAVRNADAHAKRKFEIYGGKHSNEPPFGRVPKVARVTLQDVSLGSLGNREAARRERKMNLMASLFSMN